MGWDTILRTITCRIGTMSYWFTDLGLLKILFTFFGGIVAGLYGSSVGSGGLVSLPVLILVGLPTHIAIATNRFAAAFLEVTAALRFRKEMRFNIPFALQLGALAAMGAIIGSNVVLSIEPQMLNSVVAAALVWVLCILILRKKIGMGYKLKLGKHHLILLIFGTFLLGLYGGFFGAGFGTFIMKLLVATGYSYLNGAALSRVIGSVMSIVATATFAYHGVIDYSLGISLGIGYAIGGWIGAGISIKRGDKYIRVLLLIVIIISIAKLVV